MNCFQGTLNFTFNESKAPIITFNITSNIVNNGFYCVIKEKKVLTFYIFELQLTTSNELTTSAVDCLGMTPFERYQISLEAKMVSCEFNQIAVTTGINEHNKHLSNLTNYH